MQPLADERPGGRNHEHPVHVPALEAHRVFLLRALERVHAQVREHRRTQDLERRLPHPQAFGVLLQERHLPRPVAQRRHRSVVGPVDELLARPCPFALQGGRLIVRTCLPVIDWPAEDRRLWEESTTAPASLLDDGGSRSRLRATTNRNVAKSYGRWLHWLTEQGLLDPDVPPGARITRDRVKAFMHALLDGGNEYSTASQRIGELRAAARAIAPDRNWDWLKAPARNLRNKAIPKQDKPLALPGADELVDLGFDLMKASRMITELGLGAVLYRDGLMIAFLALQPLRLKNLAQLEVGQTLTKTGNSWAFFFTADQTKTRRPIEGIWPAMLNEPLATYLTEMRPLLAQRRRTSQTEPGQHLWLSAEGTRLSEKRIHAAIENRTRERFGYELSPHMPLRRSEQLDCRVHMRQIVLRLCNLRLVGPDPPEDLGPLIRQRLNSQEFCHASIGAEPPLPS